MDSRLDEGLVVVQVYVAEFGLKINLSHFCVCHLFVLGPQSVTFWVLTLGPTRLNEPIQETALA